MSLIHWWPLVDDAKDKIDNIEFSGSFNKQPGGKIGLSFARQNSSQLTISNDTRLNGLIDFSIAMWVRFSNTSSSAWSDIFGLKLSNGTIEDVFRTEVTSTGGNSFGIFNNSITGTSGSAAPFSLTKNEWTHLIVTKSGSTVTSYLNGIAQASTTLSAWRNAYTIGNFYIGNSGMYCDYNDVRIYNHILSKKEIKELSRALILHYNFNDPSAEPTKNLLTGVWGHTNFNNATLGTYGGFTNQLNNGPIEVVNFKGRRCLRIKGISGDRVSSQLRCYNTYATKAGKTYTVSCDYYSTATISGLKIERYGGDYSWAGTSSTYATLGQWQRLSITLTNTSDTTFYIFFYANLDTYSYITNIQVEEKDHPTPYTEGERKCGNIADNSGYGNNATVLSPDVGSFTCDYVKKGSRAFKTISGTTTTRLATSLNPSFINGQGTICLWYKKDTTAFNFNNGDFLIATQRTGNYFGAMNATSIWHDNSSCSGFYIDGIATTNASTARNTDWHFYVFTGVNLSNWSTFYMHSHPDEQWLYRGYIGDFRIYNTILTQEDILTLYKASQLIDRDGNEFISEINECSNTSKVTRDSLHKMNYLSEIIQLDDGSHWIQIQHHNNRAGTNFFPRHESGNPKFDYSTNFVYNNDESWAGFHLINHVPRPNTSEYEFLSVEEKMSGDGVIMRRWAQRQNPMDTSPLTETVAEHNKVAASNSANNGFRPIQNMLGIMGGLRRNGAEAFFKLAVDQSESSGSYDWWYGAFGCWTDYGGKIPVARGSGAVEYNTAGVLDLYMRIDPAKINYREFSDGVIMPNTIYEN